MKWIDSSTFKKYLLLAWPISLQSIMTNVLSMVDVVMVSHLGDAAVGAVGLGNRFQFMLMVILLGVAWTVGVLSAQYYGAGKADRIRKTVLMAAGLSTTALVPIIILNIFFADNFIALGSKNQEVIHQGQMYLWYVIPSLLFIGVILSFENAIRALGQTRFPMVLSFVAIVLNIILNYWLINGGFGVPAMGVAGAALATALARLFHMLLIIALLKQQKHLLSPRKIRPVWPDRLERNKIVCGISCSNDD